MLYACIDFETYSEAGYLLDIRSFKWAALANSPSRGLQAVGSSVYSEHPSTQVLSLAYDLNDDKGPRIWHHGLQQPHDLFQHVENGGILEAFNSSFEWYIWLNVCTAKMGWPKLELKQLRCAMSKAHAYALPGNLKNCGGALNLEIVKDSEGKRLLNKFSKPRNATKNNKNLRFNLSDDHTDALNLFNYNIRDIQAQAAISEAIPELQHDELELWQLDQVINTRGVYIDMEALGSCKAIIKKATTKYINRLLEITDGQIDSINKLAKIKKWLEDTQDLNVTDLTSDTVKVLLESDNLTEKAREVLEIRSILSSASVKKIFAIERLVSKDDRLRNNFIYCGATRTGRFSGKGAQLQNSFSSGPKVTKCQKCKHYYGINNTVSCPWCDALQVPKKTQWCVNAVDDVLKIMATKDLAKLEMFYNDPLLCVSGCIRGLLSCPKGLDMICSDYSAIEAVVLAQLAGEQWRIDVFNSHGKIYEMSASQITGIPFIDIIQYRIDNGVHHPVRKRVGKVAELASGYQGGVKAWQRFGADTYFKSESEIKNAVDKWRAASPNIVKLWHGLENAAKQAVQFAGETFAYNGISYTVVNNVLLCKLLSGRMLAYHHPALVRELTPWGAETLKLTYMGYNRDSTQGPIGWVRMSTYGGKLCENACQATARDILAYALLAIDGDTYQVILHVHDEIVAYVAEGYGSIEDYEAIMSTMPPWCADWPVKARGGWRGKRYRKD